jgi:hypothetical protein
MKLVFTIVHCDINTEVKNTMFIVETGFLFCEAQAEAKETVEHRARFITSIEYL